ncbi:MAG: hypothetical protein JST40_00130 [Armatimonadetes bacterium]|nr:hypothetical protein [Armatimonadota bacterium]
MANTEDTFEVDRIIHRLKAGDESALDLLRKHLYRRMLRSALDVTGQMPQAEDAVAVTLAKVWRKRDLLPETWTEASRYVIAMAHTAAIDIIRIREEQATKVPLDEARKLVAEEIPVEGIDEELEEALCKVESLLIPQLSARHLKVLTPVAAMIQQTEEQNMQDVYRQVATEKGMNAGSVRNSWCDAGKILQNVLCSLGWGDCGDSDVRFVLGRIGSRLGSASAL